MSNYGEKCYKKFIAENASFGEYDCTSCDGCLLNSNCGGEYYMSYTEYLNMVKDYEKRTGKSYE